MNRLKAAFITLAVFVLLVANWACWTYHRGVLPPPLISQLHYDSEALARWIPRSHDNGVQQMVLAGNAYTRGVNAGHLTRDLLLRQEQTLVGKLRHWVPNDFVMQSLVLLGMTWFKGAERYFEPWMTEEMYGVSQSAPDQFAYLIDNYTRQIAYHGLHEVGQLMVDQMGDNMGCTVAAIPFGTSWVMGRNFDFEGGRIFDDEKIVKWVFPEHGHAYLSVIWAGMVGAVTGVNDSGIYMSINAAGSKDFARQGQPSTLVLLKVLQFASNADEALEIVRQAPMFITDIFVLFDARRGRLYRIEKSPSRTDVLPLTKPAIVTNHLLASDFVNDPVNNFRRRDLTSEERSVRGQVLVDQLAASHPKTSSDARDGVLAILRDKGELHGQAIPLGHRRAIDPLIATHSIVYDGTTETFYVGNGPGASGAYTGFDLHRSFATRSPVTSEVLPADPKVTPEIFANVQRGRELVSEAQGLVHDKHCDQAAQVLATVPAEFRPHYTYLAAHGDLERCRGHLSDARADWQAALAQEPAYASESEALKKRLAL